MSSVCTVTSVMVLLEFLVVHDLCVMNHFFDASIRVLSCILNCTSICVVPLTCSCFTVVSKTIANVSPKEVFAETIHLRILIWISDFVNLVVVQCVEQGLPEAGCDLVKAVG